MIVQNLIIFCHIIICAVSHRNSSGVLLSPDLLAPTLTTMLAPTPRYPPSNGSSSAVRLPVCSPFSPYPSSSPLRQPLPTLLCLLSPSPPHRRHSLSTMHDLRAASRRAAPHLAAPRRKRATIVRDGTAGEQPP